MTFDIEKATGNHLLEAKLATDQTVEDLGERYRISATVVDSEWLWSWLRGFGDAVSGIKKHAASMPNIPKG